LTKSDRRFLDQNGYLELSPIAPAHLEAWQCATAEIGTDVGRGGTRRLLDVVPASLIRETGLSDVVRDALGPRAHLTRAIFFDKTPETNWKVPWHQDLHLAVERRAELPGYGPWSVKEGILHVIPPPGVLTQMLALRLHLDPCGAENGPLRVLPGTHRNRWAPQEIEALREEIPEHECHLEEGGVLLVRPLLVHSSPVAALPGHRRVVHLEYCAAELPAELTSH
jgi:hypothetical protein